MITKKYFDLFLMHLETGQRYPLSGNEVIIGRETGQIIYRDDAKLSQKHCVLEASKNGVTVRDLNSINGTWIDEKRLEPGRSYHLKHGSILRIGEQSLKLQNAVEVRKNLIRRRKRKKDNSEFTFTLATLSLLVGFIAIIYFWQKTIKDRPSEPQVIVSPYQKLEVEVESVLADYRQMALVFREEKENPSALVEKIRLQLLPTLIGVSSKLEIVEPSSEFERRRLDLTRRLLKSLVGQLNAYTILTKTKQRKFAIEMEKYALEAEKINNQLQSLNRMTIKKRAPSGALQSK